jgi:ketosteroid isomerase-like protein
MPLERRIRTDDLLTMKRDSIISHGGRVSMKLGHVIPVAIVTFVLTFMPGATSFAQSTDENAIIALDNRLVDSFNKLDVKKFNRCYVDDYKAVFFIDTTPLQIVGSGAWFKLNDDFIHSVRSMDMKIKDLVIAVGGDLAGTHSILSMDWTDKQGAHHEVGRYTQILKKIDGKWVIWHEHFSLPYDPATDKIVRDAK